MSTLSRRPSRSNALFASTVAIAIGVFAASPVHAQTMSNSFGGLSKNSGEPINIESDVLVVHDAQKYATFKGNVKAVQGTTTLRSRELDVHYVGSGSDNLTKGPDTTGATPAAATKPGDPKPAGGADASNGTQISKIEARGEVVITSDQDQTTTSDWALYDVPAQLVTVGGNVVLMQGKNVLKGDRLVIDLKTGESRFETRAIPALVAESVPCSCRRTPSLAMTVPRTASLAVTNRRTSPAATKALRISRASKAQARTRLRLPSLPQLPSPRPTYPCRFFRAHHNRAGEGVHPSLTSLCLK